MSLSDWLKISWLIEHKTSAGEISRYFALAERDLKDCQNIELSQDRRFLIAYQAALHCATAALAASGYRAARGDHHYRPIQSLEFTIESDRKIIDKLDFFRKKRNTSEYDFAGAVSETELEEMIQLAHELKEAVIIWLKENHPELLST